MNEEKLEKKFEQYRKLSEQDKNIDVASLMINALQKQTENLLSSREKKWAYIISLGFPPFGLIFAVKFYLSDKDDSRQAAIICVVLTILSFFVAWLFIKIMLSGSNVDLNQIKEINPDEIRQLYE